jgi:hypothetical protein
MNQRDLTIYRDFENKCLQIHAIKRIHLSHRMEVMLPRDHKSFPFLIWFLSFFSICMQRERIQRKYTILRDPDEACDLSFCPRPSVMYTGQSSKFAWIVSNAKVSATINCAILLLFFPKAIYMSA